MNKSTDSDFFRCAAVFKINHAVDDIKGFIPGMEMRGPAGSLGRVVDADFVTAGLAIVRKDSDEQ